MTKTEVLSLLKENTNKRGIVNWNKDDANTGGLKSFGIGLTQLRKLAKQIGRDHELALKLWKSDNYDVKIISLLIGEPKKLTKEQAEEQESVLDALPNDPKGMALSVSFELQGTLEVTEKQPRRHPTSAGVTR